MARPSKYKPEMIEQGRKLCEAGALDRDLAQVFGISLTTLYEWKQRYPEFAESIRLSKDTADDAVELALFRKATGYSFDSEKVFQFEGAPVRVAIVEHVPPSDTAMIFWLKNRRPDQWRDKTETDLNVKGDLASIVAERRARVTNGNEG